MTEKKYAVRYLGDGVYASFDGYHVWLHVGSHDSPPVVALDPDVFAALDDYTRSLRIETEEDAE